MRHIEKLKKVPKEYLILVIVIVLIAVVGLNDLRKSKPSVNNTVSSPNNLSQGNTIEKEEGNISVSVQYLPEKSNGNSIFFNIALNNHAVSLDSFDFQKGVTLVKDGNTYSPINVTAEGTGHHRSAGISFKSVKVPFTVVILDLGGIARREFSF